MTKGVTDGDCVKIPDGRIGRVRAVTKEGVKVRVRRKTSNIHQLLTFPPDQIEWAECPAGWMSPDGYQRYLKVTLEKMQQRCAAGAKRQ